MEKGKLFGKDRRNEANSYTVLTSRTLIMEVQVLMHLLQISRITFQHRMPRTSR
jgi:hypothetical protein